MIAQINSRLVSYLNIIRPLNSIIAFFSTFIGSLIILGVDDYISNISVIVIGSLITFFVSAGGFVINDIFDTTSTFQFVKPIFILHICL